MLLIEDDGALARLITSYLGYESDVPIQVEVVDRLTRGLDELAKGQIDVVLLGLDLPGLTGVEVCHRRRNEGFTCPEVMLTAQQGSWRR